MRNVYDNEWLSNVAQMSGLEKTAGYETPADLPIPISACDPLSGDALYGDDLNDDQLRRGRSTYPGPDRTGRPAKVEMEKQARHSKLAGPATRSLDVSDLASKAEQNMAQDPRFQRVRKPEHRRELSLLLSALQDGLSYQAVSDALFGDTEAVTPELAAAYGFDELEGYMMGRAVEGAPMEPASQEAQVDQMLREWSAAKARIVELQAEMKPFTQQEAQLKSMIGSIMGGWEDKMRKVDDVLYVYSEHERTNPSYGKVLERVRLLVDEKLNSEIDALIKEFSSTSKVEDIKIKGKDSDTPKGRGRKAGRLLQAFDMGEADPRAVRELTTRLLGMFRAVDRTLSEILRGLQAGLGSEDSMQRAARYVNSSRRAEADWMDGIVLATVGGFKDGDSVTDPSGKSGTATVTPDGKLSVQFTDGGTATFDDAAVNAGAVKRSVRRV